MYRSVLAISDHHIHRCDNGRMVDSQPCAICHTRRPRRYCPGVRGDICPICCGTERENTVSCPLDCPYLREARLREKEPDIDPAQTVYPEVKVDESFLQRNEPLLVILAAGLAWIALERESAIDSDVREALDGLIQSYQTAQRSGLYYHVTPTNTIAAGIQKAMQDRIAEIEKMLRESGSTLRDSDLLGVLVFLLRVEKQRNNGRRRGRAYIDFLREFFPPEPPQQPEESRLILP